MTPQFIVDGTTKFDLDQGDIGKILCFKDENPTLVISRFLLRLNITLK